MAGRALAFVAGAAHTAAACARLRTILAAGSQGTMRAGESGATTIHHRNQGDLE